MHQTLSDAGDDCYDPAGSIGSPVQPAKVRQSRNGQLLLRRTWLVQSEDTNDSSPRVVIRKRDFRSIGRKSPIAINVLTPACARQLPAETLNGVDCVVDVRLAGLNRLRDAAFAAWQRTAELVRHACLQHFRGGSPGYRSSR